MAIWVNRWRRDLDKITTPRLRRSTRLVPTLASTEEGAFWPFASLSGASLIVTGSLLAPAHIARRSSGRPGRHLRLQHQQQTMAAPRLGSDRKFIELNRSEMNYLR
jgi:hypothetical protein